MNAYNVRAIQFYNFKSDSLKPVLNEIFKKHSKIHKEYYIEDMSIQSNSITMKQAKSVISFRIILKEKMAAKELENKLNKIYLSSIDKIINDIKNNFQFFDFKSLQEEFFVQEKAMEKAERRIKREKYDNLINSKFFKEYPPTPAQCNETKEICLEKFASYYDFIYRILESNSVFYLSNENFGAFSAGNKSIIEIYNDFFTNRNLFDIDKMKFTNLNQYLNKNETAINNKKIEFLSKKYDEFKKTEFYSEYNLNIPCRDYNKGCFKQTSEHFSKILYQHQLESRNPFEVESIEPKKPIDGYILKDAPIVLGLTTILTYIFFVLTNKFFRRTKK
jgi:hypothetical protein